MTLYAWIRNVEDDQRPAWLTPSWPIVLTEHRRQTRNNDVALKLRTARSGFTSGLLQRQIGDGSHADGDQWPMLHAMMTDMVALSARPKEGIDKHVPHVDMLVATDRRCCITGAMAVMRLEIDRLASTDIQHVNHVRGQSLHGYCTW